MSNRDNLIKWEPCNIYDTAIIGDNVSIGMFSEIGHKVIIGNDVSIANGVFIPEGVTIEDNCFIGPHACFSNDKFPPSQRKDWKETIVKKGAAIGANVSILPGVIIGENSIVGMGSVVTKDVPEGATVCGVPARILEKKENVS